MRSLRAGPAQLGATRSPPSRLVFLLALAAGAGCRALLLRRVSADASSPGRSPPRGASRRSRVCWTFVRLTDGLAIRRACRRGWSNTSRASCGLVVRDCRTRRRSPRVSCCRRCGNHGRQRGQLRASARRVDELPTSSAASAVRSRQGSWCCRWLEAARGIPAGRRRRRSLTRRTRSSTSIAVCARSLYAGLVLLVVVADPLRAPLTFLRSGETVQALLESRVRHRERRRHRRRPASCGWTTYYVLGGSAAATQRATSLGLIPLLLHPAPRRVAFIGMATGISASAAAGARVDDRRSSRSFRGRRGWPDVHFGKWNAGLLDRRDVRLVARRRPSLSGRHRRAVRRHRVGSVHSLARRPPAISTRVEMYRTVARARLRDGGLFCQWLPLYQLTREEFDDHRADRS